MKLKLLSIICLLAYTLSASAAEEFEICGLSITDELAAQGNLVPTLNALEGVEATGVITYNSATQTLVLENAEITYTPDHEDEVIYFTKEATDFTIQLIGTNKLTNAYANAANAIVFPKNNHPNVTITGEGSLEVTSNNWYAVSLFSGKLYIHDTTVTFNGDIADNSNIGGTLEIKNATVTVSAVHSLGDIVLSQCAIVEPEDAIIKPHLWYMEERYYDIYKKGMDKIVIKPTESLTQFETSDGIKYAIKNATAKTAMAVSNSYHLYPSRNYNVQPQVSYNGVTYSVTGIADYAFGNTYVTNVTIPEGIWIIGDYAFEYCSFKKFVVPSTVNHIGDMAFAHCSELTDIELKEGLETIGNQAFLLCTGLTTVTIPSTVVRMVNSFLKCYNLETVIVKRQEPAEINYDTFSPSVYNEATLVVPDGTIEAYKAANNWKNFQHIIEQSAYNATSITEPSADAANSGQWYDLQGRHIPAQPMMKGIYIQRGRKTIR